MSFRSRAGVDNAGGRESRESVERLAEPTHQVDTEIARAYMKKRLTLLCRWPLAPTTTSYDPHPRRPSADAG